MAKKVDVRCVICRRRAAPELRLSGMCVACFRAWPADAASKSETTPLDYAAWGARRARAEVARLLRR